MSGNSEAKELMEAVAFLYALLLLIDEVADKAQKDGDYYEISAALVKIRELIEPIREDKKNVKS